MRPATDWPIHDHSQTVPITSSSEFEYRKVRTPPAFAQLGDSAVACSPTFCSSSDSRPTLAGSLDSGDPRWISHTVPRMNSVNWRYSDCQFSSTSTAKDEDRT